jgi:leader peptidase (prepilin peptidase)/N-methyltransferase
MMRHASCNHCGHPLGRFYPAVKLAALAVAIVSVSVHEPEQAWLDCLLGWWLLALGWIELRRWLLPDALTLPLIFIGLAVDGVRASPTAPRLDRTPPIWIPASRGRSYRTLDL